VVNSTNETHKKLIASIQKNMDSLLKERPKTEAAFTGLEVSLSEALARTKATEVACAEAVRREQDEACKIEERVTNIQASVREMQERLNEKRKDEDTIIKLRDSVTEAKDDLGRRIQQNSAKLTQMEHFVGKYNNTI